jgi:pimeloyl-ACP methyl ester carboxylesterase
MNAAALVAWPARVRDTAAVLRLESRVVVWAAAAVALVLATVGLVMLLDDGPVTTRSVSADGVPLLVVTGADRAEAGVVVAHGFAGSARLMAGFADTLARRGYAVAIPDLSGHGTNPRRLRLDEDSVLARDLDVSVRYLRATFGLPEDRIALIGHSMGAGAVTRYAVEHPTVPATVAISLGTAEHVTMAPDRPRNLLVIVGGLEFAGFRAAAVQALGDPDAGPGETIGRVDDGTARSMFVVPGREHISVLFADRTHMQAANWIDVALGRPSTLVEPHARDRLVPAGVLLLGCLIGFVPVTALVPRRPTSPPPAPNWKRTAVGAGAGVVTAVLAAQFLPTVALPLAVGGYAAGFFVVFGVAFLVVARGWRRATGTAAVVPVAVALAAYAAAAIAVPVHLGFTNALPVGPRWWLLVVVALAAFVLLLGVELVAAGRAIVRAALLGVTAASLGAAAVLGTGPGFILLVLPLLVLLFAWHLGWSAVLAGRGAQAWLRALPGAVLVAWPIATTLPLVG